MAYSVAVIGTGAEPDDPGRDGYAMAYHHAAGYENHDDCELLACADIVRENAAAFADEFGLADDAVFTDYGEMLDAVEPDIVSVCVPPAVHADIVVDCVEHGAVRAVHCEKPMADTFAGAERMVAAADDHDVQVTFNHQRRFSDAVRTAKELLDDGRIGDLERVEFAAPVGLFDYGSHSLDLCNYFNDERSAEWVMGQVHYTEENVLFGTHNENQAMVQWEYENGVHGIGGVDASGDGGPAAAFACHNRLVGTEGTIEVGPHGDDDDDDPPALRVRTDGEWEAVDVDDGLHDWAFVDRAIAENVRCLAEGEEPELSAANALKATEIIFGTWESARRRRRVDLPLDIEGNPLEEMVESGELDPQPRADEVEAE